MQLCATTTAAAAVAAAAHIHERDLSFASSILNIISTKYVSNANEFFPFPVANLVQAG